MRFGKIYQIIRLMQFARERYTGRLYDEMLPLFQKHWKEIAHYKDIYLDWDHKHYENAQDAEVLRVFTLREDIAGRDELIGYALFYVRRNPHYWSSVQAAQDIIYLDERFRGKFIGSHFIKWCDEQLAAEGVQAVYHHVKAAHDFGPLLKRQGYELVDYVYGKRLDKPRARSDA